MNNFSNEDIEILKQMINEYKEKQDKDKMKLEYINFMLTTPEQKVDYFMDLPKIGNPEKRYHVSSTEETYLWRDNKYVKLAHISLKE